MSDFIASGEDEADPRQNNEALVAQILDAARTLGMTLGVDKADIRSGILLGLPRTLRLRALQALGPLLVSMFEDGALVGLVDQATGEPLRVRPGVVDRGGHSVAALLIGKAGGSVFSTFRRDVAEDLLATRGALVTDNAGGMTLMTLGDEVATDELAIEPLGMARPRPTRRRIPPG